MKKIFICVILFNIICHAQLPKIPAIEFSPRKYVCYKTPQEMTIDGTAGELAWQKAEWTEYFTDIEGTLKPEPGLKTRVKMLWDENYFYIYAELQEPDVWGTLKKRDTVIFYDNDFELFIDPDGDTHSYAELELNALNTVWDLFLIQPYRDIEKAALSGWDIKGIKTSTAIQGTINNPADKDSGWTAEIALPWTAFSEFSLTHVPPFEGDQWRLNFSRVEWKTKAVDGQYQKVRNLQTGKPYSEDNWVWSPHGIVNIHYPELWGYVQFTEAKAGADKITFIQRPEEPYKWLLRKIYYAERNFHIVEQRYTCDFSELDSQIIENKELNRIAIECTSDSFTASVMIDDKVLKIDQSGLIRLIKK